MDETNERTIPNKLCTSQNWILCQNSTLGTQHFINRKLGFCTGVLNWGGRVNILTNKVSELASYLAMPQEGHLEAIFHLFNYLETKHNARIVFDPSYPNVVDIPVFKECDWKVFYGDVK
jgi:hypothetical protein